MAEENSNFGSLVQIARFNGQNFQQWKFRIKCALKAKGVYGVIDGTKVKPAEGAYEQWNKQDALAMCIMTSSMELTQISLIENCNTAKKVMDKLCSIYELKSETNKMVVHEQFYQYKMSPTDSIAQHVSKVENLARQIKESGDNISDTAIIIKILSS